MVRLAVYDAMGRQIVVLRDCAMNEGRYEVVWEGRDAAGRDVGSGIYFYNLKAGDASRTMKMVLVR